MFRIFLDCLQKIKLSKNSRNIFLNPCIIKSYDTFSVKNWNENLVKNHYFQDFDEEAFTKICFIIDDVIIHFWTFLKIFQISNWYLKHVEIWSHLDNFIKSYANFEILGFNRVLALVLYFHNKLINPDLLGLWSWNLVFPLLLRFC